MTKRYLTNEEIDYIISFLQPDKSLPFHVANSMYENVRIKLYNDLKKIQTYPKLIPTIKNEIEQNYYSSLIQPGTSVGIIMSQSLGEKSTQSTLNTFHITGSTDTTVISGIPRLEQLLRVSQNIKRTVYRTYFKENNTSITQLREHVNHNLISLTLKSVTKTIIINLNKEAEKWYKGFEILYHDKFTTYKHCITILLDINVIYKYRLTYDIIANAIENEFNDISCVFSPLSEAQIDIYVDTSKITLSENIQYINEENKEYIYLEECVLPILEKIIICGIKNLDTIYYLKENDTWLCEIYGKNYKKILGHPIVDSTRTLSCDICDIYSTLGLEASRLFLINELQNIMSGINLCHIKLLADKMTFNGILSSISRHSLKKTSIGCLSKSTFEQSLDVFIDSAVDNQVDKLNSVSSSIIVGKRAKIGTGYFDLKLDLEKMI